MVQGDSSVLCECVILQGDNSVLCECVMITRL